uniref:Uncharacterized protein n=1 Tax=Ciona savignyi TaxID=51511 RepID=H2YG93_CIOSA
ILKKIGSSGKYQIIVCGLLISSTAPNGFLALVTVFTHIIPSHYCKVPVLEALAQQQNISKNSSVYKSWLNFSLPLEENADGVLARSQCKRYSDLGFTWNGTVAIPTN